MGSRRVLRCGGCCWGGACWRLRGRVSIKPRGQRVKSSYEDEQQALIQLTYPITRLDPTIPYGLHHTSLLIAHIPHPIRLACSDEHMRRPATETAI